MSKPPLPWLPLAVRLRTNLGGDPQTGAGGSRQWVQMAPIALFAGSQRATRRRCSPARRGGALPESCSGSDTVRSRARGCAARVRLSAVSRTLVHAEAARPNPELICAPLLGSSLELGACSPPAPRPGVLLGSPPQGRPSPVDNRAAARCLCRCRRRVRRDRPRDADVEARGFTYGRARRTRAAYVQWHRIDVEKAE